MFPLVRIQPAVQPPLSHQFRPAADSQSSRQKSSARFKRQPRQLIPIRLDLPSLRANQGISPPANFVCTVPAALGRCLTIQKQAPTSAANVFLVRFREGSTGRQMGARDHDSENSSFYTASGEGRHRTSWGANDRFFQTGHSRMSTWNQLNGLNRLLSAVPL